ncbi:MAG: hypothetical protein RRX92_04195 [Lachnospiraceae bacterium]
MKKRMCFLFLFIGVVLSIGISNWKTNDYYSKSFSYNSYQALEGASQIDEEGKRCYIWSQEQGACSSVATSPFALEKGEYSITVQYSTTSPKNTISIISKMAVTDKNEKGILLGTVNFDPEKNEITLPIDCERLFLDAEMQFLCEEGELSILDTAIKSTTPHYNDSLFLSILIIMGILLLVWYGQRKKSDENDLGIILILGITIFIATLPYLNDFLIHGHDISHHLARIEGIYYGMKYGEIPLRINPIQLYGYGNAMPIMYPDIFLYIPALLRVCGISLMLSYKIFILIINVATVVISYVSFKHLMNDKWTGVIGSIIYSLCAYRLLNIYERAALGEILAMVFFPLLVWSIYEIIVGNSKKWIGASIAYACIFMSHMLSTLMIVFFTLLTVVIFFPRLCREKQRIFHLFCAAGMTILMILWCALPLFSYMRLPFHIGVLTSPLHESGVYFSQVFSQNWGGGFLGNVTLGTTKSEMPLTLGLTLLIGVILFLISYFAVKEKNERNYKIGAFTLIMGGIALFMASWMFPWEALQKIAVIDAISSKMQFAFRLLLITSIFWSITATIGIVSFFDTNRSEKTKILIVIMLFACSLQFLDGTLEKETFSNKSETIAMNANDDLYMYQGINPYNWYLNGECIIPSSDAAVQISGYTKKGTSISFYSEVECVSENSYFDVPLAYYPGYIAKAEGEELPVMMSDKGMVRFSMPQESGTITVEYKEKPIWAIGNVLSLITWMGIAVIAIKKQLKQR